MTLSHGLSLWLQPTGQAYHRLDAIIKQLAVEYHAPLFEPHVTLLGDFLEDKEDLIAKTEQLVRQLHPGKIKLTTLDHRDAYFRCFFVHAEKTDWLVDANNKAREIFHRENSPAFMAHLSLLYGDFPVTQKQATIAKLGTRLDIEYSVSILKLVSTDGEPKDWYKVEEFQLR